ncbi:MAG: twin-arginine translocase subunit TatC [Bacteroidota bacterium]|nr:twin-arginine translocase subunit TatC [Bacteroidota bacterium]
MSNNIKERKAFFRKFRGQATEGAEMSFIDHLEVLRWHIFRVAIVLVLVALAVFFYNGWVFDNIILAPSQNSFITYHGLCNLSHRLHLGDSLCMPPINFQLLGSTVSGPFMSAISISFMCAIIIAFPYLMWELWRFIKPALSAKEISYARGSIGWVSLCFFCGAAFGYYLLAPFTFNFLANFQLGKLGVYKYMPTLDDYIDTLTSLILGCGLAFELPVLAYVLSKLGLITPKFLKNYRKYAYVIILFVAAVITPSPDWTSQTIVAVPLILLYEISIFICKRVDKQKAKAEAQWD